MRDKRPGAACAGGEHIHHQYYRGRFPTSPRTLKPAVISL